MASTQSPAKKKSKLSLKLTRKKNRHSNTADDESNPPAESYACDDDTNNYQMFDDQCEIPDGPHELPPPHCGLNNLGNTCYFNSVLQALRYTPGFCDGLKTLAEVAQTVEDEDGAKQTKQQSSDSKKLYQLVIKLNQLFDEMKFREETFILQPSPDHEMSVYPEEVLNSIRDLNPIFQGYLQHDSQELLCSLLSKLQDASQKLQQLSKEEKETPKLYKHSKLSLQKHTQEKTVKSDGKTPKSNNVTDSVTDEKVETEAHHNSSDEKSSKSANEAGASADAVEKSNGPVFSPSAIDSKNENRISNGKETSRKRWSSSRDTEVDEEPATAPQRKVKKKARTMTRSSGSMVKSKAGMSGDNCMNGNGDVSKAVIVNGSGDANGKMSQESKSTSGKSKKRLVLGRIRALLNQPTILSKFGFVKKDGTPVNRISYKSLQNEVKNGTEGSLANGTSESVKTEINRHECFNQTNKNSNQSQAHVPNSSEKCSKSKADLKSSSPTETKHSPTSTNNEKSGCHVTLVGSTPTNRKSGCVQTDKAATNESPEVECIGEVECLGTVSSVDKRLRTVEKMFQGSLVLRTRCMECEGFTERREDFQDISVPVQRMQKATESDEDDQIPGRPSHLSLSWALSEYACAEKLTAENKYFCESCRHHAEAERTMLFGSLPPVLSVQLKRFCAFSGSLAFGGVSKVNDHLATPLSLCLTQWCTKQCRQRKQKYALYAVVMHRGVSSSSGHYVCYARIPAARLEAVSFGSDEATGVIDEENNAEIWANFDDDRVTVYSDEEFSQVLHPISGSLITATPYLLFYKSMEMQ